MAGKKESNVPARRTIADVDPFFRDFFDSPIRWPDLFKSIGSEGVGRWAPAMDLTETPEGYAITVELPAGNVESLKVLPGVKEVRPDQLLGQ